MFTYALDMILVFMITTPVLGWALDKKTYRETLGMYAAIGLSVTAYFLFVLYEEVAEKGIVLIVGQLPFSPSLGACFKVDMLSLYLSFIYIISGLFGISYSIKYMEHDTGLIQYYTLLLGLIAGMIGITFAGDFFTMFVFLEFMSLASYALVAFRKERWEPIEAGFKYLIMSAAGSATILLAMSFLYGMTGTLNFAGLAASLSNPTHHGWLYLTLTLIIVGFGIKTAIVPFHTWLPDAHSAAPSPVSALLSGVVVQTCAYALIRILILAFGSVLSVWQTTLAIFAIFTMSGGNIMAFLQHELKRLLAFSTIAQTGYILFGFAIATQYGLTASLFHLMNHAITKGLLFLCAGSFLHQTKTQDLRKLGGIRRTMPMTSMFLTIGALAIAGIPPLSGFWSEWLIMAAGIRGGFVLFTALMLANLVLSVVYYLRVIRTILLDKPTVVSQKAKEAPAPLLIPLFVLAALCVIIGSYPGPFITMASRAAEALLNIQAYIGSMP